MAQIKIPFKPEMAKQIWLGRKTVTRRYKKYGNVGDYFFIKSCGTEQKYTLTRVYKEELGKVDEEEAKKEGFDSFNGFVSLWIKIHPGRGFTDSDLVWVHRWD